MLMSFKKFVVRFCSNTNFKHLALAGPRQQIDARGALKKLLAEACWIFEESVVKV